MAVKEILGVETSGFVVLVVSAVVLLLGLPAAARVGGQQTGAFRRTGILYGVLLLALLFGTVFIVKLAE